MTKFKRFLPLAMILVLVGSGSAFGRTIDFVSTDWQPAIGLHLYTVNYGSHSVTATANSGVTSEVGRLSWQAISGGDSSDDGLGVQGGDYDEIDGYESLLIEIDEGMKLTGAWLTDLYDYDPTYIGYQEDFLKPEYGHLLINDSISYDFWAEDKQYTHNSNGEKFIPFNDFDGWVTSIEFFPGFDLNDLHPYANEYSVAGLQAVPLPATIMLFGSGLIALSGLRRRMFRKN